MAEITEHTQNLIPTTAAGTDRDDTWVLFGATGVIGSGVDAPSGPVMLARGDQTPEAALAAGRRCAIVWPHPHDVLSEALTAGTDPAAAADLWMDMARDLLRLIQAHRQRLVLIAGDVLSHPDQDARAALRAQLGLRDWVRRDKNGNKNADPVMDGLARLVTAAMADLADLLRAVERESIVRNSTQAPMRDAAMIVTRQQALQTACDVQHQHNDHSRDEVRLLHEQLRLQQEAVLRQACDLDAGRAGQAAEIVRLQTEIVTMSAHAVRSAAPARPHPAAEELRAVYASTSWRVTGPMRRVGRFLGRLRG